MRQIAHPAEGVAACPNQHCQANDDDRSAHRVIIAAGRAKGCDSQVAIGNSQFAICRTLLA
jgi:hypothetical protein